MITDNIIFDFIPFLLIVFDGVAHLTRGRAVKALPLFRVDYRVNFRALGLNTYVESGPRSVYGLMDLS
jgi:hypothetical protein